jgi:hypothetical protein
MKMKPEDKKYLKKGIQSLINQYGIDNIRKYKESLKQSKDYKDFDVYFSWALFWAATYKDNARYLYSYLTDDHITTALKRIVKELGV